MFKMAVASVMNGRRDKNCVTIDAEHVKSLLSLRKEEAISKLLMIFCQTRMFDEETYFTLLKTLPVLFSYAIVLNRLMASRVQKLICSVMNHPSFAKDRNLFHAWRARVAEIENADPLDHKRTPCLTDKMDVFSMNQFQLLIIRGCNGNDLIDPIAYSDIDFFLSFHRYLKFHKLHKYLFFFGNLSYYEIMNITSENIRTYEDKVDILPMTEGARNAILRKLTDLKLREQRLLTISSVVKGFNPVDLGNIDKLIEEIRNMIRTPIRGNSGVLLETSERLPKLISATLRMLTSAVILHIRGTNNETRLQQVAIVTKALCGLLRKAWASHFFDEYEKNEFNEFRRIMETALRKREYELVKFLRHRQLISLMAVAWKE